MRLNTFVVLLCVASVSMAGEKPDRQLAEGYLAVTDMQGIMNTSLKQYDDQLTKSLSSEQSAQVRKMMADTMSWNVVKDQLVDVLLKVYSRKELEAYITFAKTPEGKSYNAKSDEFSKQFALLTSANMQRVLAKCCATKN